MGLLMIGAVVVLVCLVGCVGSSSESRFMLVVVSYGPDVVTHSILLRESDRNVPKSTVWVG